MFRILRIDSRFRGNDREEDGNDREEDGNDREEDGNDNELVIVLPIIPEM